MGLSSSKSTTKTNQTTSGTTTPTNPSWVTDPLKDFTGKIQAFGNTDPYGYIAGASPLQQQAWDAADNLGGWMGQNQQATNMAQQAGNAGPNLAGPANTAQAATYQAPQLGNAATYDPVKLAQAVQATGQGYNATNANAVDASSQSLLDNLSAYQNPYTSQVVDATLSDFDENSGRLRAQQAAQAAKAGAFGGSRYGIREAQTEGELARGRASTQAGLLDQAFKTAAGLSADDANRRQQVSLFNAGNQTGVNLANAGAANQASAFGANAGNQASLANQAAQNQFALQQGAYNDAAARYGADAANQFALAQAGFDASSGQFNAGNQQQANLFNANAANENQMFNASQRDSQLMRQLQAAGLIGDLGNSAADNVRGDLSLASAMGADQRAVEQQRLLAPLAQLEAMGQLYASQPYNLFTGQQINGTMSGTSQTKSTPSLFQSLMDLGSKAASAYAAGK